MAATKEKKPKKKEAGEAKEGGSGITATVEAVAPRLAELYATTVAPALAKQFGYKNKNQVPKLEKIVVNRGLGAAVANPKIIDSATEEMRSITGQKPVVTRSKKAIASFKLRAGLPIGVMVTLRQQH